VRRGGGAIGGGGGLGLGRRLRRRGGVGRAARDGQDLLAGRTRALLTCQLVLDVEQLLAFGVGALESDRHDRSPVVVVSGDGAEGIVSRPRGAVLLSRRQDSDSGDALVLYRPACYRLQGSGTQI